MAQQILPDGSSNDFAYDARGNLLALTNHPASGAPQVTTCAYNYATDGDRLGRVTYPNGRWVAFAYDALGRRRQLSDSTGHTNNYLYDNHGQFWRLLDGSSNLVVEYLYDPAGRFQRVNKGNGTFTTYDYDAAGRVLHLTNSAPDGSVHSRFDYTFDSRGRRRTMSTVDGNWTYDYDGTGQLIHAALASTNPAIPSQDLRYTYDPAGNRTSTVINGSSTDYVASPLNDYATVGGTTFQYDADGNLTFDGVSSYTYDSQSRLVNVAGPEGATQYEYDAFGNRTATTFGGQRTEYLLDPTGPVNLIAEYDASGNLLARTVHGLGLVGRSEGAGALNYFDADVVGSTAAVTDPAGAVADSYAYDPFGGNLAAVESVANPFQFNGQSQASGETPMGSSTCGRDVTPRSWAGS